jgi:DNA-binding response OmpR family regulator/anti-sigma regulatory factor (Ser/Thr protein kinase)
MARILIAEDSPDIRALICMLLEAEGHQISWVGDGKAAVQAARTERPDLVLMDLSLPLLSGWEAAREIRSDPVAGSIPIVAVTAHAMHGDRERALAAGCDGFIAKPIDEDTFAGRVLAYLDRRPSVARSPRYGQEPGRILVVDDQTEVAELIRADLATEGHEVVVLNTVAEASRRLAAEKSFDLAIIDVMLGSGTGYDIVEEVRAGLEYVPVLLVTAGTIDRERGFSAGADDFIGKPIDTMELRARARSLIRVGRAIRGERRIGEERSQSYRKLAELDRLKSDFLSTVSHELRTPLNTIILLAHQLEKATGDGGPQDGQSRNVQILRGAAETLRQMIDNILDLAKLEAGQQDLHSERVPVAELLEETANLLEPQASAKGLEVRVEVGPGTPATAVLDRGKLTRVLVNLLSNAVKYTAAGSVVLQARPFQSSLTFSVADTGVGIPEDLISKAFEPFQQIRTRSGEAPRGTGLGLSISKQLVELMGGDLILESREGRGTTVTFTVPELPLDSTVLPSPPSLSPSPGVPLIAGRQPRVLVVEDDEASRYGMQALLESEGYAVIAAGTLKAAEAALTAGELDVVLLDVTLPDGDGAIWLESRRRADAETPPVLALTGVTADEDTRRIQQSGVRRVLTKPVNVTQLLLILKETLEPDA